MERQDQLLDEVTAIVSEAMGRQTGELFYKFYELENADEVMLGARSLLEEFMGAEMTEKKLKAVRRKS